MKQIIPLITVFALLTQSCKKNNRIPSPDDEVLISKAKTYFDKINTTTDLKGTESNYILTRPNPRLSTDRKVLWAKAMVMKALGKQYVIAPVIYQKDFFFSTNFSGANYYSVSNLVKICLSPDTNEIFQIRMLTYFPDSNYSQGGFTGIVFLDRWDGSPIMKYKYQSGRPIQSQNIKTNPSAQTKVEVNSSTQINVVSITELCPTIYGYNYSEADPGVIYYWSEPAGCSYTIDPGNTYVGSPPGPIIGTIGSLSPWNGFSPASTILVTGGNNIIGNIIDYNKCFTNIPGSDHEYSVTVCVDQPVHGSRQPWGISTSVAGASSGGSSPVNVGHSFIVFSETTGSNTITRNLGWYPSSSITPFTPKSTGNLNDDEQHNYNISLTISLTNSQFFNMLTFVQQNSADIYDLNSFNCVSFVLKTLLAGNVSLTSATGSWPGGSGNDPGDLGEDIRIMNILPGMTRNINYSSHPNLATCN
jgi:hypothetical protein